MTVWPINAANAGFPASDPNAGIRPSNGALAALSRRRPHPARAGQQMWPAVALMSGDISSHSAGANQGRDRVDVERNAGLCEIRKMPERPAGRLVGRPAGWSVGRLVGRLVGRQRCCAALRSAARRAHPPRCPTSVRARPTSVGEGGQRPHRQRSQHYAGENDREHARPERAPMDGPEEHEIA